MSHCIKSYLFLLASALQRNDYFGNFLSNKRKVTLRLKKQIIQHFSQYPLYLFQHRILPLIDNSEPELILQTPKLNINSKKRLRLKSIELKLSQRMGNLTQYTFLKFSWCSSCISKELEPTQNSKATVRLTTNRLFKKPRLPRSVAATEPREFLWCMRMCF